MNEPLKPDHAYIFDKEGRVIKEIRPCPRGDGKSRRQIAIEEGRLKPTPDHVVKAAIARHKELQASRRDAS